MLRFFSKIRYQLAAENKVAKYIRYAIGEIILVVIGILIALSINNWNEAKKEHHLETRILNEILSNMDSDLKNLDEKIALNNFFILNNTKVLEHLNSDLPITDSLRYNYSMLYGQGNFQPNTIGYDNLKSIGINIIRNENLKKEISELYSFKYYNFVENRRMTVKRFQDLQLDEIYKNINEIKPLKIAEPINLKELRFNIQFKNAISFNIILLEGVNKNYNKGKKEIELVMQSIRKELNK